MPARAFTTYRSAGPVLPEFLSNLKNLFKVAYIYLYQGCAARIQNSENFSILKGGLMEIFIMRNHHFENQNQQDLFDV